MATNENLIPIPGRLHSVAMEGHVAGADEIVDDTKNKKQSVINAEVDETIGDDNTAGTIKGRIKTAESKLDTLNGDSSTSGSVAKAVADAKTELIGGATSNGNTLKKVEDRTATLETAVGSNGSVDQRIAAAKSEVIGDAASDYNTLGKLEDKIQAEASARQDAITAETNRATTRENQIYDLVHTPEQHYVTVATYAELANIASPSDDTIYRVSSYNGNTSQVDNTVYSEYGYDGTNFVFLCVKSQIDEVYDISAHHSNNTYVDLAAALDGGNNIPQELRRGGMSIKFVQSSDNKYMQFRLKKNVWSVAPSDWQSENTDDNPTAGSGNLVKSGGVYFKINQEKQRAEASEQHLQESIDSVKEETLEENREMVNSILENYAPVEITGDVTNAPDEEDLTSVNVGGTDVLKFKDKAYNPLTYSGMGRVYLRKNIVNGVNTLTQDMFYKGEIGSREPNTNTIFVIQYDYVIDSANDNTITIPADCVLKFEGGSLKNGTLVLTNTYINGSTNCLKNIVLNGSCSNNVFEIDWFDIDRTGSNICTSAIQSAFAVSTPEIHFGSGRYAFNAVEINHSCIVRGSGRNNTILVGQCRKVGYKGGDTLLFFKNSDSVTVSDLQITCVDTLNLSYEAGLINLPLLRFDTLNKVVIDNIFYNQCHRAKVAKTAQTDWDYNDVVALLLCDDVNNTLINNSEFYDSYGGERICVLYSDKQREDINVMFKNNYIHDADDTNVGNTPLTVTCNNIYVENNIVEDWHIDVSIFNLFGLNIFISDNTIKNCRNTMTVFDCSEWGQITNYIITCINNFVECESGIMLMANCANVTVNSNILKGLSLFILDSKFSDGSEVPLISDRRHINIQDNTVDSTFYDVDFAKTKGTNTRKSAICLNTTRYLYADINITNNYIKFERDYELQDDTEVRDSWRGIVPIKVYHNYGTTTIENNIIEGVFPLSVTSSYARQCIRILVLTATTQGYTAGPIFIKANIIIETSGFNVTNSKLVDFAYTKTDAKPYNVVDIQHACIEKNTLNGSFLDYFSCTRVTFRNVSSFKGNIANGALYNLLGFVTNTFVPAYIESNRTFTNNAYNLLAYESCSVYNKIYESVSDIGQTIDKCDVLFIKGHAVYQLLTNSISLSQDVIDSLITFADSTNPAQVQIGDILQDDGYGNSWRRCVYARNRVKDLKVNQSGSTRPTLNNTYHVGTIFFDTSLNPKRPIWWNGTAWVDVTGTTV